MVRWPEPYGERALALFFATIQTILHVQDGNGRALDFLANDDETLSHAANGFLACDDFPEPGTRAGLPPNRVRRMLADTAGHKTAIQTLLKKSFLPPKLRARYADTLAGRRPRLRYPLAGAA